MWKVIALNWLHTRRHSAPQRASQMSDGRHTTRKCRFPHWTDVSGHDAAAVQSIRQRPRGNPEGIGGPRVDHWPKLCVMVPDKGRVLNLFAAGKTVPRREKFGVNKLFNLLLVLRIMVYYLYTKEFNSGTKIINLRPQPGHSCWSSPGAPPELSTHWVIAEELLIRDCNNLLAEEYSPISHFV